MTVFVRSLSESAKDWIVHYHVQKKRTLADLAKMYSCSARTIGRVLQERGIATPVPRLKGEAHQAMKLLKKHNVTVEQLAIILESFSNGYPMYAMAAPRQQQAALFRPAPMTADAATHA